MFIATFMCIFEGNSSLLNLYAEVDKPQKFMSYTFSGFVIVVLACLGCGIFSYLTFGNTLTDVVLFNLPSNQNISIATKLCYFFTIMGSYVILIQPVYSLLESKKWFKDIEMEKETKTSLMRILIVFFTILISDMLPNIHAVLSLTGSFTGTLISIVVPVLFYNKAYESKKEKRKWIIRLNYAVLTIGSVIGSIGFVDSITKVIFK